jgi:hypothetical protein
LASYRLRLFIKTLVGQLPVIAEMVKAMRRVYATADIDVWDMGTEQLTLPDLAELEVGNCALPLTAEQQSLFANRNGAAATDVVAYVVHVLVPPLDGCSAHPPDRPGVVVAQDADVWTLAHEVGHILGLSHVNDDDRLMTGNGTQNITNDPPDLIPAEAQIMQGSPLVAPVPGALGPFEAALAVHELFEVKLAGLTPERLEALPMLAKSSDSTVARKAVYLASMSSDPQLAGSVVQRALDHPASEVRTVAAAAIRNLAPQIQGQVLKVARKSKERAVIRVLRRGPQMPAAESKAKGGGRSRAKRRS